MKKLYIIILSFLFITTTYSQDSTMTEVGPGVKFHSVKIPAGPWSIKILEIDISNPKIKLETVTARDVLGTGLEKTSNMAQRNETPGRIVLGAVNGDYFGISDPTNPYTFLASSMIDDGEFVFGKTTVRSSFSVKDNGKPVLEVLSFSGSVIKGDSTRNFNEVNGERGTNQLVLYNKYIGATTRTNSFGTEVKLYPIEDINVNGPVRFIAVSVESNVGNMAIDSSYVLSGHGTAASFLTNNISVNDTVVLVLGTAPDRDNIAALVGGGPRMIVDGAIPGSFVGYENFGESHVNSRHPRSAVGYNQDSTKVYFLVVDGRQPALSVGMSITELATYMRSIGCYNALNLDGGGSSALVVRNNVTNSPSDGNERSVANALIAVAEVDVKEIIGSLNLDPSHILIDSTQTRKINVTGTDLWGYSVPVSPADITWQIIGIGGSIDSEGFYVPAGTGSGTIIGTINGLSDTVTVQVVGNLLPVWSFSSAGGNLPTWFSTSASTERGFAYGYVGGKDRIYVVNRPNITILNAITGDNVGTLSTTGVSGGTYPVNNIEVSADNKIFLGNLTLATTTSPFKVYMYADENTPPVEVISFAGSAGRLGDKFTVVGSYSDNTAVVYAAVNSSNMVYKWTMADGSFIQTPTAITLSGMTNTGTSPAVYPRGLGDSNFFVNGNSMQPKEYTPTGSLVATLTSNLIDSRSNAMRYIESGDRRFLIAYQYGTSNENAKVLDITNGLADATLLETTPSLGTNANTIGTSGDIAYRVYQQGVFIYYVLATNNGIAAYQLVDDQNVPVELTLFKASVTGSDVNLVWSTASELNNNGFEIQRKTGERGEWSVIGFKGGRGTTTETTEYVYTDNLGGMSAESIYYRLKQIDLDGTFTYSKVVEVSVVPTVYELSQNYPNPFNPVTMINFSLQQQGHVRLAIYDVLGQEVMILRNEIMEAGKHKTELNASMLNSGIYFYKLEVNGFKDVKKMMLVK